MLLGRGFDWSSGRAVRWRCGGPGWVRVISCAKCDVGLLWALEGGGIISCEECDARQLCIVSVGGTGSCVKKSDKGSSEVCVI